MRYAAWMKLMAGVAAFCALSVIYLPALAQSYPTREVKLITGSAAGGGSDLQARLLAGVLSQMWGQPVLVENLPGASNGLAAGKVAHSAPDGYTLAFISSSVLGTLLTQPPPVDIEKDLMPVDLVSTGPAVLVVNPSLPVHTVQELIDLARSEPGKLNYATGGVGTTAHLAGELLKKLAKIDMLHVSYAGTTASVVATQNGEAQLSFPGPGSARPALAANSVRAIAVTNAKRSPLLPSLPTISETIPGFDMGDWYGVFAPRGAPKELVDQLSKDVARAVSDPDFAKKLADAGYETQNISPADFAAMVHNAIEQYVSLASEIGLTAQ